MTASDDELRAGFDALRRVDAMSAPALDVLMDRPVVRRRHGLLISGGVLAAAAAALVVLMLHPSSPTELPPLEVSVDPDTPSLLTWQSPTAALVDMAVADVLTASSTVTSSLIRGAIIDVRPLLPTGR